VPDHSPEPWRVLHTESGPVLRDADGKWPMENLEANLERAALCVNFCRYISAEWMAANMGDCREPMQIVQLVNQQHTGHDHTHCINADGGHSQMPPGGFPDAATVLYGNSVEDKP
jgi:hypothetical protein